jgi:prevent-host-death family protein
MSVAEAKAQFTRLVADAEAGREVIITRRGIEVARMVGMSQPKEPLNLKSLAAFRATVKPGKKMAVELIREVRRARY